MEDWIVSENKIDIFLDWDDEEETKALPIWPPLDTMPIAETRLETLQICKVLQCVREEDRDQIKKLHTNGVPQLINYNDPKEGDTALGIAAVANNDSMIEFLLELGAHPDIVDFKGRSAIMRAAEYGHVQCVEKLAQAKCNMTLTDTDGKGVLFYCISPTQRHQKCMEMLLEQNADVNNKSKDGGAVFLQACETAKDNEKACLMMLEKGADPNSKNDKTKRTALMAAAGSGSAVVVRAILERGAEVNMLMMKVKTHAAHEAAKGGYLDVLQVMSAYGANFDQTDDQGNTPIHLAAKFGHGLCCRFLGQRGCNPKPKNSDGFTARLLAKEEGHKEPIKECRKAEKSFGKIGKNNEPWALALYDHCFERREQLLDSFQKLDGDQLGAVSKEDFIEVLTNVGAPIPEANDLKKIILAIDRGRDEGLDYNEFLSAKKYINKLYLMSAFDGKKKKKKGGKGKKKGKTKIPMVICTQPDGPRVADGGPPEVYIPHHIHFTDTKRFDRDAPPENPLQDDSAWYLQHPDKSYLNVNDAAKHGDFDSLKDAFAKGTPIDVRDKYFKTPLMVACVYANIEVVKFLVDNGADVNAHDNFKWTPLHFACHSGMKDLVEYLLERGANLEATTLNGATPFIRAIQSSKPDVVQYLIDRGCKVQIENKKGQNPVDIAGYWADPRVYDIVRTKWDSLPPPPDKKKGAKKGGAAKRPASTPSGDAVSAKGTARAESPQEENNNATHHRKGSILRAASALAGGIEEREDITFTPLKVWTKQPTTQQLLCAREEKRQRYGWEVDFSDFKMPFLKNVANRVEEFGGFDDE